VELQTLAELSAPDPRTLHFTPLGLATGGTMRPEDAAEFQQAAIASADLDVRVPESVQMNFERLRSTHAHGVIFYDAFTIVFGLRWTVMEHALRERFIEFYAGRVTMTSKAEGTLEFDTPTFASYRDIDRKWRLEPGLGLSPIDAPKTLGPLLRWARLVGLLDGQRNRTIEGHLFAQMRNWFAHGAGFELVTPTESARAIRDLAELINRLWGVRTPDGRRYADERTRGLVVIGWSGTEPDASIVSMHAHLLGDADLEFDAWTFVVLLAVPDDPNLREYDARYEKTLFPAELLWGPSDRASTAAYLSECRRDVDSVGVIDRLFAVRQHGDKTFLAQSVPVLLGLPADRHAGTWCLLRADDPLDAFNHVRNPTATEHRSKGTCSCPVETVIVGSWEEVRATALELEPCASATEWQQVHVPRRFPVANDVGDD
jgi:hypothetical protein